MEYAPSLFIAGYGPKEIPTNTSGPGYSISSVPVLQSFFPHRLPKYRRAWARFLR